MLIIFLLLAIAAYVGLYFVWDYLSGHMTQPIAWMATLNRMIVAPDQLIFVLLRGLILVTILYVVGDFLLSGGKRLLKKKPPPDEMKLKSVVKTEENED